MRIKRIIALTLALLCFATVALADIYVRTVADPTYVRSKPKIARNIQKELSAGLALEWGGNVQLDDRGIAFLMFTMAITSMGGSQVFMPACGSVKQMSISNCLS